ncbi:MAG: hypothetical protein L0956_07975 [Candidatus Mariimomonas ferrooxydans]
MEQVGIMQELLGKEVEVNTNETIYRGILIEVTENEIQLKSQYGWVSIPAEKVADIRAVD